MHRLLKKQKALFTSGTCKIAKLDNSRTNSVYFINLNSFYYGIHPDISFIKVIYEDTVAYVFPHFENGLSAISLLADAPEIDNLDEILANAARLIDFETAIARPDLKALIDEHYPDLIRQQIYYPDNIKKVITSSGKMLNSAFTALGGFLKTGVEKVGNYLNTKIDEGEPTHIKAETKQKWQKLKNGTNNFVKVSTDFAGKMLSPVIEKTRVYTNEIKQKIEHSENQTVKYAREIAQVSGKAIGEAFDGFVKGGTEVTREFGEQGKKLITKKYGDEVIKTFSGQSGQAEEPKPEGTQPAQKIQLNQPKKQEENSEVRLNETGENLYPHLKD